MSGEGALQSQEPGFSGAEAVASPHALSFNMLYAKKVKLSTVLDQTEETEVPELTPDAYNRLLKNHQELVGEVPLPEAGPTEDQLVACHRQRRYSHCIVGGFKLHCEPGMASANRWKLQGGHRPQALRTSQLGQLAGVSTKPRFCACTEAFRALCQELPEA